jgi:hypothetical protein
MNKVNEASPANKVSDVERVVMRLQHQYTTQNDGGGVNGFCRVNNGDLLMLLRKVERLTALADEPMRVIAAASIREATRRPDLIGYDGVLLSEILMRNVREYIQDA